MIKKAIGRVLLNDNKLLMYEVEIISVLNSRPVSHV